MAINTLEKLKDLIRTRTWATKGARYSVFGKLEDWEAEDGSLVILLATPTTYAAWAWEDTRTTSFTEIELEYCSFKELRLALSGKNNHPAPDTDTEIIKCAGFDNAITLKSKVSDSDYTAFVETVVDLDSTQFCMTRVDVSQIDLEEFTPQMLNLPEIIDAHRAANKVARALVNTIIATKRKKH